MSIADAMPWVEANQRYLSAAIAVIRETIRVLHEPDANGLAAARADFAAVENATGTPALTRVVEAFGLSRFERDVLLLCCAVELDSRTASLVGKVMRVNDAAAPTFGLALSALEGAHWSAVTPAAPLRAWHLIELTGDSPTQSPLRIDERILNYVAGIDEPDDRLKFCARSVAFGEMHLSSGEQRSADRLAQIWNGGDSEPAAALEGASNGALALVSASAAARLGVRLAVLRPNAVALGQGDLVIRLLEREARLTGSALAVDCTSGDETERAQRDLVRKAVESVPRVVMLGRLDHLDALRPLVFIDVPQADPREQRHWWTAALGSRGVPEPMVDALVSTFQLSRSEIEAATRSARLLAGDGNLSRELWRSCRASARPAMRGLAQHIESSVTWDDLILAEQQKELLRRIVLAVRYRLRVYHDWGFAGPGKRGLGLAVLFAGPSGVGKTMASEVMANELGLDLYRIDLSQVVNKYIGETEKNLRRIFAAAEAGGAILHFDEAESLFGKRSEVRDSHDRYANIEVGYLLQQMESFRGLAILATNMKSALDHAFLRRLRFVVSFAFPDAGMREQIWSRVFPASAPTEGLDYAALATMSLTGANIRNIAVDAAFSAADANTPITMEHVMEAARREFEKNEQPLAEIAIRPNKNASRSS